MCNHYFLLQHTHATHIFCVIIFIFRYDGNEFFLFKVWEVRAADLSISPTHRAAISIVSYSNFLGLKCFTAKYLFIFLLQLGFIPGA